MLTPCHTHPEYCLFYNFVEYLKVTLEIRIFSQFHGWGTAKVNAYVLASIFTQRPSSEKEKKKSSLSCDAL